MTTKTKIIIAVVIVLLIAGSVWYYLSRFTGKIKISSADWVNKKVNFTAKAGSAGFSGTADLDNLATYSGSNKQGDFYMNTSRQGNALKIQLLKKGSSPKLLDEVIVDFDSANYYHVGE